MVDFDTAGAKRVLDGEAAVPALDQYLAGGAFARHGLCRLNRNHLKRQAMDCFLNSLAKDQPITHVAGRDEVAGMMRFGVFRMRPQMVHDRINLILWQVRAGLPSTISL